MGTLLLLLACDQEINSWDGKKQPESLDSKIEEQTSSLDEESSLTWLQKGSFCSELYSIERYYNGGLKRCRAVESFTVQILGKEIRVYSDIELYQSGELHSAYLVEGQNSILSLPGEMFNNTLDIAWNPQAFRLYKSGFLKEFRVKHFGPYLPRNFPYKNNRGEWQVARRDINDNNPEPCRSDNEYTNYCWRSTRIPAIYYESGWSKEAYCLKGGVLPHIIYVEGNGCFLEVANKNWVRLYGLEKRQVYTTTLGYTSQVSVVSLQDLNGFPKAGKIACKYQEEECSYSLLATDGRYHDFFNGQEVEFDECGAVKIGKYSSNSRKIVLDPASLEPNK